VTGLGGGGLGRPSIAARNVSAAWVRARRCAAATRGRKNQAKKGSSIAPVELIATSVRAPAGDSCNVSAISGWRSGSGAIWSRPSRVVVAARRSIAAAVTSSGVAASRTSEDRGTRGMLRAQPALISEGHMATLAVGDKAPAFTLKDQNGKSVKLSDAKGKRVV